MESVPNLAVKYVFQRQLALLVILKAVVKKNTKLDFPATTNILSSKHIISSPESPIVFVLCEVEASVSSFVTETKISARCVQDATF